MELTYKSMGIELFKENYIIALAGNPNTGKSTVFNYLTGLRQHTGNWPGKTVVNAYGNFNYKNQSFLMVDLPGTYSLLANSAEEEVARNFLCFDNPDATVVVADATCLERNLNLVLQITEITKNVILCLNLMDEARRKKIDIDIEKLSTKLGVPVVPTAARQGEGMEKLVDIIYKVVTGKIKPNPIEIRYETQIENLIRNLEPKIEAFSNGVVNSRWVALRIIDGDKKILESIYQYTRPNKSDHSEEVKIADEKSKVHSIKFG